MRIDHIGTPNEQTETSIKNDTIIETLLNASHEDIDNHVDSKITINNTTIAQVNQNFVEIRKILKILLKLSIHVARKVLKL